MSTEKNEEDKAAEVPQNELSKPGLTCDACSWIDDVSSACSAGQSCRNMWINDHCDITQENKEAGEGCAERCEALGSVCCRPSGGLCGRQTGDQEAPGEDSSQAESGTQPSGEDLQSGAVDLQSDDVESQSGAVLTFGAKTQSSSSDELSGSLKSDSRSQPEDKCVRKGRFVIEEADVERSSCLSTLQYRRGRFQVTEAIELEHINKLDSKKLINIISMQNKQIDILFDMIKNISGEDKLFQKEFTLISNDVYELIGSLKKHINT